MPTPRQLTGFLVLLAPLGTVHEAHAQAAFVQDALTGSPFTEFGSAAAVDGDVLVVGARSAVGGEVVAYERSPSIVGPWTEVGRLQPPGLVFGDDFGSTVAVSGSTLVAGTGRLASNHMAWVGERNLAGIFVGVTELMPALGPFGEVADVAIQGDLAVVGDPSELGDRGAVYVFSRDLGGLDAWGELARLTASDASINTEFGRSVALDGDVLVVGAPRKGANRGAAYVFEGLTIGAITEVMKLTANDAANGDEFGSDVDVDGETIVVGADSADAGVLRPYAGKAYVFERSLAPSWGQSARLRPLRAEGYEAMGRSVAVGGDHVLVGAPFDTDACPFGYYYYYCEAGAVYRFDRDMGGPENWGRVKKYLVPPGHDEDVRFGWSVALDGYTAALAAPHDDVVTVYRAVFQPSLVVGGACPGPLTVDGTGAAPRGDVHLLAGTGPGSAAIPAGGSCAGVPSGLQSPALVATVTADASGAYSIAGTAMAGQCGAHLQVFDETSCGLGPVTPL